MVSVCACLRPRLTTDHGSMPGKCWANVEDVCPALTRHWAMISHQPGSTFTFCWRTHWAISSGFSPRATLALASSSPPPPPAAPCDILPAVAGFEPLNQAGIQFLGWTVRSVTPVAVVICCRDHDRLSWPLYAVCAVRHQRFLLLLSSCCCCC